MKKLNKLLLNTLFLIVTSYVNILPSNLNVVYEDPPMLDRDYKKNIYMHEPAGNENSPMKTFSQILDESEENYIWVVQTTVKNSSPLYSFYEATEFVSSVMKEIAWKLETIMESYEEATTESNLINAQFQSPNLDDKTNKPIKTIKLFRLEKKNPIAQCFASFFHKYTDKQSACSQFCTSCECGGVFGILGPLLIGIAYSKYDPSSCILV